MEVGRIVARIEGETADFEKKMAGAQRTFEQTGTKMAASASRVSATVQKAYTDRIVAANAAATKEIEAAQRTLRGRIQASQSTVEINAARKMYNERVALARSTANQEIALAQRAHIAATQGMRPLVANLDAVAKVSGRVGPGLNSVRSGMTSVLSSALSLAPGIGQVTGVLGSLALGQGIMIGVLAGAAALSFAWNKLTADAKRIKAAALEAAKAIDELGTTATSKFAVNMAALNEHLDRLEKRQPVLSRVANFLGSIPGMGAAAGILGRGATAAGTEAEAALKRIGKASDEIAKVNAENRKKYDEEVANARERALAVELKRIETQYRGLIVNLQLDMQRRMGTGGISTSPIGRGAQAIQAGKPNLPSFGIIRAVEALSKAGQRVEQRNAGGGFFSNLGGKLKGMIDPKMLLTGVLTGGVSTALGAISGAVGGFIGNLFSAGKRAKEAAALMKQAILDFNRSLEGARAGLSGNTKRVQELSAIEEITKFYKEWAVGAGKSGSADRMPAFDSLQKLIAYLESIEHVFLTPELTASWNALIAYAKELGISLNSASTAANAVTSALTNVPEGFKIALARFNATTGTPMVPTGPGGYIPRGGTAGITVNGDINVNGASARSGRELLEIIEREVLRKRGTGGGGLTLDFA